jgi:membrane dipeptidase
MTRAISSSLDHDKSAEPTELDAPKSRGRLCEPYALAFVVDPEAPTLSRWLDHVDHAVAVMGIEHIGLGADFVDQVAQTEQGPGLKEVLDAETVPVDKSRLGLEGFRGPDDYLSLGAALRGHGYDGGRLEAIMNRNWLRIVRAALPA